MAASEITQHRLQPELLTESELSNFALIAGVGDVAGPLTPQLREFALIVMEKCAGIADKYDDRQYGNAGDEIRALFGLQA